MIKIITLFEFGASLHFRNMVLGTKQSSTLSGKSTDTIPVNKFTPGKFFTSATWFSAQSSHQP
jgi:hypothetical protein